MVGDLALDPETRETWRDGRVIVLTRREFELLQLFMEHPRMVLSPRQIYQQLWDFDLSGNSNTLTVHVGSLRRKLGAPAAIETIRGVGYALRVAARERQAA